ncbi:MAG TPA: Lrp/AsnC ligand binding domain-containing protein [candidate division Zixibacteria bacterium]|nr:Lrp/AsnC ligand binding domain-containing protein [candidate division Zixibacteria bacterium]
MVGVAVMKLEAFVMINVNLGCETEVLRALKHVHGFEEAFYVLGDYDVIAKMTAKTIDELNQVVTHIRKLRNVKATATMITREL